MREFDRMRRFVMQKWRETVVTAMIVAVLLVCAVLGELRFSEEAQAVPVDQTALALEMSESVPDTEPFENENEAVSRISLSPEETVLIAKLESRLEENNIAEAAAILNQNEAAFRSLFYDVLGGGRYLYDGMNMTELIEGEGLVFTRPTTVFYGTFQEGKPEGDVLAVQAIELEAPRCNYSSGKWQAGRMEGFGVTGYNYYEGIDGEEIKEVEKQGKFSSDLLEGEITYIVTNSEEMAANWYFTVKNGLVSLDERWIHDEEGQSYSLLSDGDETHAYVIDEVDLGQVYWKNLILWED